MKNIYNHFKKFKSVGLVLLLIAVLGIGVTIAFFTDTENAINKISTGEVNIITEEDTSVPLTKKNIGITASGKSACYVRMRVNVPTVEYQYKDEEAIKTGCAIVTDGDGTTHPSDSDTTKWEDLPINTTINVTITRGGNAPLTASAVAQWKKLGTGEQNYWYLSEPLYPGDKVTLINEITFPGLLKESKLVDPFPNGLTKDMLTIPITSDAVQVDGISIPEGLSGAEAAQEAFRIVQQAQQNEVKIATGSNAKIIENVNNIYIKIKNKKIIFGGKNL